MDSSSSSSDRCLNKDLIKYSSTSGECVRATPQAEVFSVFVNRLGSNEGETCAGLYGTVKAVDVDGYVQFFVRSRQQTDTVLANSPLCFNGPYRSISSLVGFSVNVELQMFNGEDNGDGCGKDFEISRWQLSWDVGKPQVAYITEGKFLTEFSDKRKELSLDNLCSVEDVKYEQALKAVFRGKDGCAIMHYAILQYAVQAHVQAYIVYPWNDESWSYVEYEMDGRLSARYGNFTYDTSIDPSVEKRCEFILLDTEDSGVLDGACVKILKSPTRFELTRSVMAVPAYSSLVIEADFGYSKSKSTHNYRKKSKSTHILKGMVEFPARSEGYSVDYIYTENGEIGMKLVVNWSFRSVDIPP